MDHVETVKSSAAAKFNSKEKSSGMQNTADSAMSSRAETRSSENARSAINQPMSGMYFAPEDIARQAYALYEKQGCPQGCAEQNWFEAEQLLQRRSQGTTTPE